MSSEYDEWLEETVLKWVEVYKKSMTTFVLLELISEQDSPDASELNTSFTQRTGWDLAERALYRSLRRLTRQGLLVSSEHRVERTGLKRKTYQLTDSGISFLAQIRTERLG